MSSTLKPSISHYASNVQLLLLLVKTINKRDINFTLLNSSDTLVLVIGTKKIYYYNTKTWKLFHKITSIDSTRKYRCINASKDDKIVVIADEKTIEIYVRNKIICRIVMKMCDVIWMCMCYFLEVYYYYHYNQERFTPYIVHQSGRSILHRPPMQINQFFPYFYISYSSSSTVKPLLQALLMSYLLK